MRTGEVDRLGGLLSGPAAALDMFKDAIEDAAFRQELVFGQARLTKRDSEPLFLLELVTPLTAQQRTRA